MDKKHIIDKSIKQLKNDSFNKDKKFDKEELLLKEKEEKINNFLFNLLKNN